MHDVLAIVGQLGWAALPALRNTAALAVVFTCVGWAFAACNPGAPWWRKPDLPTDIGFALIPRLLLIYAQAAMITLGIAAFYDIKDPAQISTFLQHGHGSLGRLPFWQQIVIYLLCNDLLMYLTHRLFHTASLWRFHAVHHSSRTLEWISATRFHPVDQIFHSGLADAVMLLLGIPAEVLIVLTPWTIGSSALVHANLDWDFGCFRYVLASPVFHRWHHTHTEQGGQRNFAATFPLLDLLFGTFYMPKGQRPDQYGLDDPDYPRHFLGLITAPFSRAPQSD